MRVVIFIGHHKVGSTSLQDFLSRNSVALAKAGILYPATDFEGMSVMLAQAILGKPVDDLPINAREPHNALAFKLMAERDLWKMPPYHKGLPASSQMLRSINMQIRYLHPHTVILTAEVLANFGAVQPALIERLAKAFSGAALTVVATFRRIDEYLASWFGQRLRFGAPSLEPLRSDGMAQYFNNIHFDYQMMLGPWRQKLPSAEFILRDYRQVQAAGGSVPDFVAQTRLTLPDQLRPERKTNESFHRGIFEIARLGNRALPRDKAGVLRDFLVKITPDLGLPPSGDIELFGTGNREILIDRFEPIDAYLGEIVGQAGFFPDLLEARKPRPVPEREAFALAASGIRQRSDMIGEDSVIRAFLSDLPNDIPA